MRASRIVLTLLLISQVAAAAPLNVATWLKNADEAKKNENWLEAWIYISVASDFVGTGDALATEYDEVALKLGNPKRVSTTAMRAVAHQLSYLPLNLWLSATLTFYFGFFLIFFMRRRHFLLIRLMQLCLTGFVIGVSALAILDSAALPPLSFVNDPSALRSGYGEDYVAIGKLQTGEEIEILARENAWLRVQAASGSMGWVEAKNVVVFAGGKIRPIDLTSGQF